MKRNLYLAAGMLLTSFISRDAVSQCQSGYTPNSVTYTHTVTNAFGTEFHQFSVPKFGLTGTFLNAHIRTFVTLHDFNYQMENPNPTSVFYRVGAQKEDFITSPDIPISFDNAILERTPNYQLQPSDGVPGSGTDFRSGSMGDVWTGEPVIDEIDGGGYYQGSGNILFELETSTYNPYGNPNVITTYSSLSTTFEITYNYCSQVILSDDVINFSALKIDDEKYGLFWNVSEEMPGRKYLIEKSLDGKNFSIDGSLAGLGTTQGMAGYKYSGKRASGKEHALYFRIVQVEAGGEKKYSPVKRIEWQRDFYAIDVFPNPARDHVGIDLRSHSSKDWNIQIFSLDGKAVQQSNIKTPNGFSRLQLNNTIQRGMYILKATSVSGGTSVSTKLFVDR